MDIMEDEGQWAEEGGDDFLGRFGAPHDRVQRTALRTRMVQLEREEAELEARLAQGPGGGITMDQLIQAEHRLRDNNEEQAALRRQAQGIRSHETYTFLVPPEGALAFQKRKRALSVFDTPAERNTRQRVLQSYRRRPIEQIFPVHHNYVGVGLGLGNEEQHEYIFGMV